MNNLRQPGYAVGIPQVRFSEPASVVTSLPAAYWLVLLFLLLLYANTPIIIPALEALRPAQLVAVMALGALLLSALLGKTTLSIAWPQGGLLLAFVGAAALSCLSALWPRYAIEALSDLGKMALIFLLLVNCATTLSGVRGVMWTLLIGGLFPALGTWMNYIRGNLVEGRAAWVGIFENPNEAAYGLVILLPLAAYLATETGWTSRLMLGAISGIYLGAIFLTFSRGGMVGLAAVIVAYSWRTKNIWLSAVLIAGALAAAVLIAPYWARSDDFSELSSDYTLRQRVATSKAGVDMFLDHPLTGVGLNCSVVAWPLYAPPGLYTRGALVTHNTIIQVLSETGLVGFLPFALFVGLGLRSARKMALTPETANLGTGIETALWGLLACAMSGGYLLTWFPYILLGLAAAARRVTEAEQ